MNVVLSGYYGKNNIGDEALLATLLQMLPKKVKPIALTFAPKITAESYQIETCDRLNLSAIFRTLRQADALIWGGGSLMQDVTSIKSPLYYGGLMLLAQTMGLKTIAWGQGIGPLKLSISKSLTKLCLSNCTGISVRDRASADLLDTWQIPYTLAPDPVWALGGNISTHFSSLSTTAKNRDLVAVNLRSFLHLTPDQITVLSVALSDFQKKTNTFILLLPFQASQDLPLAELLHCRLPNDSQILLLANPLELKSVFDQVKMAIGMRLHFLIMATASQCPCFALSYDPKVTQLMNDLAIPGYLLSELPLEAKIISQAWQECYDQRAVVTTDLVNQMRDRAFLHQQLLSHVLGI